MSMFDEQNRVDVERIEGAESAVNNPVGGVGGRLRAAREAREMSVEDVARMLKLSGHQVVAIESGDWNSLPGKTIIRGFVRNYARLVGLDGDRLMAEMNGLGVHQSPELKPITGTPVSLPREGKADRRDVVRVAFGIILLAVAMLIYFFLPHDAWQSVVSAYEAVTQLNETAKEPVVQPQALAVVAEDQPEAAVVPGLATAETAAQPAEASAVQSKPEGGARENETAATAVVTPIEGMPTPQAETTAPATLSATAVLKFKFTEPSWVEIRDRTGKTLLSQLNAAGTEREIVGEPPLSLVVGNASNVTLWYKGKLVEMSKRSKDDVARLTIE